MHGERTAHGHRGAEDKQREEQPCPSSSARACIRSFVKCGRHISVGDCALFQAGKALPYVGIIRKVSIDEEGAIQLAVNWLYRPADVKLAKGVPFETAPNEIFYSFHKDSISAVSLLHPCKVAFLCKGVELPLGISSFVCRRVYDVANKRLWWLTDRDYTDDHQEEVDQLLDRTKIEMQAAVQSGVASPRALAANPSCQLPKANSDNAPNSALSIAKTKKRERTDQNSEPSKRERSAKAEESELLLVKRDRTMKADDISAITDKDGGLFNLAGVDKLLVLMHQERSDAHRKVADVASRRILLTSIIAATEKEDCLNRFVQLGGLPMLDDWLQEAHKGKFGDEESPKEGEKVFEELLLTLLRALDRLPVDLDALKTCIVGKSVNNLRSHKNTEIQKKARKLVDIWKKRVDAEMKQSGDVKPGPSQPIAWSSRQQPQGGDSLTSHPGKNGGPPDITLKNAKAISNGSSSSAEAITKAVIVSPMTGKVCNLFSHNSPGTKDGHQAKHPNSSMPADVSSASVKEEKSSCSSQSQNYGPSWSSAPIKGTINASWKEDARNSSVPLLNSKGAGLVLRSNGKALVGPNAPGSQKEISGGKPLVWSRNAVNEKSSNPGAVSEKGVDMGHSEVPSNQRLIVRLPNPGRSPARTVSAGSMADSPVPSRGSSPSVQEKHATCTPADLADGKSRVLCNAQTEVSAEAISELRSSTGGKGRATDGDVKQSDALLEDKRENEKSIAKDSVQTARNCSNGEENHLQNGQQIAGVNSCISTVSAQKASTDGSTEADSSWKGDNSALAAHVVEDASRAVNATTMGVNDGAMSILATVAASEDGICTGSDCGPVTGARGADQEKQGIASSSSPGDTSNKNHLCSDKELSVVVGADDCKQVLHLSDSQIASSGTAKSGEMARNGAKILVCDPEAFPANLPSGTSASDGIIDTEKEKSISRQSSSLEGEGKANATNRHGSPGLCVESNGKPLQLTEFTPDSAKEKNESNVDTSRIGQGADERSAATDSCLEKSSRSVENISSRLDDLSGVASEQQLRRDKESTSGSPEEDALEVARQVAKEVEQEMEKYSRPPVSGASSELEMQDVKLTVIQESTDKKSGTTESSRLNPSDEDMKSEEQSTRFLGKQVTDAADNERKLEEVNSGKLSMSTTSDEVKQSGVALIDDLGKTLQADPKGSEVSIPHLKQHLLSNAGQSILRSLQFANQTRGSSAQVISFGGCSSAASAHDSLKMEKARCNDVTGRPVFDLNEGLEDNIQEESALMVTSSFSAIISTTVSVSSAASNGLTAPIAVVASTNGSFIPPASPLRVNKELGWKGSAATSAFRPAEPRRTPERQQTLESPAAGSHYGSTGKLVRPPLDIDLNVVDDRFMEDMGSTTFAPQTSSLKLGGHVTTSRDALVSNVRLSNEGQNSGFVGTRPDLDLNRVDDSGDGVSDLRGLEIKSGNGPSLVTRNIVRDFDLNDGPMPSFEETGHDEPELLHVPSRSSGVPMMLPATGLRMSAEMPNVTPWFPPGNSFSTVAIPAFPGSRGDPAYPVAAAQSFLNAGMCVTPFNNEIYRSGAAALSSSSAVAFPTAPPCVYPYSAFPFGASFPLSSGSFGPSSAAFVDAASVSSYPSISSQMVTPAAVAPAFVRPPFLMNLPEGASADSNGVWGRLNLDLNAGPEAVDTDAGNVRRPFILSGQVSIEDQMRAIRQVGAAPGVALKRKEPEGGLEVYRSGAKHAWR